ncbi:MAG: hypothetical protein JWM21_905 [Acidobacteria bacterium]|nr:hypothetical protein [Acidobacteriota bacterium]
MKSSLLLCAAVLSLGLSLQCSHTAQKAGDIGGNNSTSRPTANSQSEDHAELKRRYEAMETEIESESRKLAIENLKARRIADEIRVWVGFGVTYPRLFILQLSGERHATFLTFTTPQDRHAGDKMEATATKTALGPPKSGWDELEKSLKVKGIGSPLRLSQESSQYTRSPDVQVIVIEVKSGGEYGMVFFHLDNKSDDAQTALSVCRRIEQDFLINMYCGSFSTEKTVSP